MCLWHIASAASLVVLIILECGAEIFACVSLCSVKLENGLFLLAIGAWSFYCFRFTRTVLYEFIKPSLRTESAAEIFGRLRDSARKVKFLFPERC